MDRQLNELEQNRLAELEQAFELFNQTSSQLTQAYDALQHKVTDLQNQLAASQQEKYRVGERLEQLLTLLPAGVVVLNADDEITEMNPSAEKILGYDAFGRNWDVVVRNVFLTKNDAGELITHKQKVYQYSESPLNMAQSASAPPVIGRIILIQDVSSARELQNHISRHQRLNSMGEMAASLAHQIRTPLSSALLYVSQMTKPELTSEKQRLFVEKSLTSLRHLESLVKDMLQYAKGGLGHNQPVLVDEIIRQLQIAVDPFVKKCEAEVKFPMVFENVQILGDADGLVTALQNLIVNAVEVVPDHAVIEVTVNKLDDDWVDLSVRDNGPGIEETDLEKIFEPFFTSRAQGTGLGLAVVRAVAEAHKGEAWVQSIVNRGATFGLRLPILKHNLTE